MNAYFSRFPLAARTLLLALTLGLCLLPRFVAAGVVETTTTFDFVQGWNLVGKGSDGAIDVAGSFSDQTRFVSLWKWDAARNTWAFYSPALAAQGGTVLADFVAARGYQLLATISGSEGFWVNAAQADSLTVPSGNAVTTTALGAALVQGWNLVAVGASVTAKQFADAQAGGVTTLWAWDATARGWYFHAPSLEASSTMGNYISSKGYRDFTANSKLLGKGVGFWVNKP